MAYHWEKILIQFNYCYDLIYSSQPFVEIRLVIFTQLDEAPFPTSCHDLYIFTSSLEEVTFVSKLSFTKIGS